MDLKDLLPLGIVGAVGFIIWRKFGAQLMAPAQIGLPAQPAITPATAVTGAFFWEHQFPNSTPPGFPAAPAGTHYSCVKVTGANGSDQYLCKLYQVA